MKEAHEYFVKQTPIRTGNARRSTRLKNYDIFADYRYAGRLDKGYSRQAPEGMSKPTIKKFKEWISRYIKLGN